MWDSWMCVCTVGEWDVGACGGGGCVGYGYMCVDVGCVWLRGMACGYLCGCGGVGGVGMVGCVGMVEMGCVRGCGCMWLGCVGGFAPICCL